MGDSDEDRYSEAQSGAFIVEAMITGGDWPHAACAKACRAALAALADRLPERAADDTPSLALDIELADDRRVAEINARYRDREGATNVLSFPAIAETEIAALRKTGANSAGKAAPQRTLGALILADGVIAREARDQAKSRMDHLGHLVVHGVLHVMGLDHDIVRRARIMEAAERDILAGLGIGDPYSARVMDA